MKETEKLYTPQDIANLGLLSLVLQWQLRKSGKLPHYRIGRKILYSQAHLDGYLATCEQNAKGRLIDQPSAALSPSEPPMAEGPKS